MLRGARPTERLPPPQERPAVLRGAVALRASPAFRLRPGPPHGLPGVCAVWPPGGACRGQSARPAEQPSAPWPAPGVLS